MVFPVGSLGLKKETVVIGTNAIPGTGRTLDVGKVIP